MRGFNEKKKMTQLWKTDILERDQGGNTTEAK